MCIRDRFKRLGLGSVLGYLAAGLAIGPFGIGWFSDPRSILHVAELGVVMFLFIIGLEMQQMCIRDSLQLAREARAKSLRVKLNGGADAARLRQMLNPFRAEPENLSLIHI